ncbi:hypothetical protein Tco_0912895 [Tanacetum coccineum]
MALSNKALKGTRTEEEYKWAFVIIFDQDVQTFTGTMFLNLDQLERHLDKEEFQENRSMAAFKIEEGNVYMGKALDASLVVTERSGTESGKQDTSSRSGNDADADNADIKPVYDKESMAEVQLTIKCNVIAKEQQHAEQPDFINKERVDQDAEQCHDTRPLLAKLIKNKTTELSHQSLESENIFLKKTVAQNSSKSVSTSTLKETYGSNDMIHNYYLEDARKKTQERGRNLRPSVMPSVRSQSTDNGIPEAAESSSRNVHNSNMHTLYQRHRFYYHRTKDHPLEQVCGNPSKPIQTRQQLATNSKMCMFVLTVSMVEPKNIKEAMADHAWIKAMQEELHQFNRLKVWELVDKPFEKTVINLKWLWKNKKDE